MDKDYYFYTYPQIIKSYQPIFKQKENPKGVIKKDESFTYPQDY